MENTITPEQIAHLDKLRAAEIDTDEKLAALGEEFDEDE
jgi:hypothetical protein